MTGRDPAWTTTAVVAHAAGDLRVERVDVPVPPADAAVVRIAYGGICGSDLGYWLKGAAGESILRQPLVLGHEVVGRVLHPAKDGTGPPPGTPVAVHPATPRPGRGSYPAARPNLSPGCTYLGSAAQLPHTQGAFSELAVIPSRMLRPLPAGLPLRTAALAEPTSVAWHAVTRAGEVRGKRVLVVGSGPIGLLAIAVLRRAGATEILATDVHEFPLGLARDLGATGTFRAGQVKALEDVSADVVLECSGTVGGLNAAIRAAARGGRVVMVGLLPTGEQPVPMSLAITRELELTGSFRFNDEIDDVLLALNDGSLDIESVVTHEFPVSEALKAFTVAHDASISAKVLLAF